MRRMVTARFGNHVTAALALALALLATACLARVSGTGRSTARSPSLVLIAGDVWVLEDYDEPVFYTEASYWRFSGGVWYSSPYYNQDWVRVTVVPSSIQRIDRPTRYAHYTAPAEAPRQVGPPSHAPAHGVRGTPPGHDGRPRGELQPGRGQPDGAAAAPPPGHGPTDVGKPDEGHGSDHAKKPAKGKADDPPGKEKGGKKK